MIWATHELQFTVNFDSIVVLESGHLAGQGTHVELLEKCDLYKELWELDTSISRVGRVDEKTTTIGNLRHGG